MDHNLLRLIHPAGGIASFKSQKYKIWKFYLLLKKIFSVNKLIRFFSLFLFIRFISAMAAKFSKLDASLKTLIRIYPAIHSKYKL